MHTTTWYVGFEPLVGDVRLAIRTALARVDDKEISVSEASGVVIGHATPNGWQWTNLGRLCYASDVDEAALSLIRKPKTSN